MSRSTGKWNVFKNSRSCVNGIVDRMQEVYMVTNDVDLAAELGIALSTVENWRKFRPVNYSLLLESASGRGYNLHWLLTGDGDMVAPGACGDEGLEEEND